MFFVKHEVEDISRIADLVNSEQLSQQQIQGLFHERCFTRLLKTV